MQSSIFQIISFSLLTLFSMQSHASTYRCTLEYFEGYAVEVDLGSEKAALFESGRWTVVPLVFNGPALGLSGLFRFSGVDRQRQPIVIDFDTAEGDSKSSVTFKDDGSLVTVKVSCLPVQPLELISGLNQPPPLRHSRR